MGIVTGLPGAAVRVINLGDQRGQVVILIMDTAPQRVGFLEQPGELVVLEGQLVAIGQSQAGHVAGVVQLDGVMITAVVARQSWRVAVAGHHAIGKISGLENE